MPLKDPEAMRVYRREWMRKRRAAFFDGKVCIECGVAERLELHHRDPAEKLHHAIWSWAEPRRRAEIAKCDVLCRDCHRSHHALERQRHGTRSRYKHGCRCVDCRQAKSRAEKSWRDSRKAALTGEDTLATIGSVT